MKLLVVDDDRDLVELLDYALRREGYDVVRAYDGETAVEAVTREKPDLVVLDINLPKLNGFEVCRILRGRPRTAQVPIIFLSARTVEGDRVSGLDLGADDYMVKPFSLRELESRVRAVLRRTKPQPADVSSQQMYRGARLTIDFESPSVSVDGCPVRLTKREFELLRCLVANRNRVLSRDRLLEQVWGYTESVETRSVDVHVGRLRNKLGSAGAQIETLIGFGYRFTE